MYLKLRNILCCSVFAMLLCLSFVAVAEAQAPTPTPTPTPTTLSQLPPADPQGLLYPIVAPEHVLSGKALLDELRKGGYVLYMRHAETGRITEQCGISNLTEAGEEQARQIGAAMRTLKIPVSEIWSSPVCRVVDTARLLDLGNVKLTDDLASTSTNATFDLALARQRRLDQVPAKGTNVMLVSHMQGSKNKHHLLQLAIGEIIVFRPVVNAGAIPVSRISAQDWRKLLTTL